MSALFRSLIVDDEQHARLNLQRQLKRFTDIIAIVGEAADGEEALQKIKELSPDLLFLDIHMPKLNAFQIIERLEKPVPRIIFTTAHDNYAIKAFDVNSIDYLLKPINPERLAQAIQKLSGPGSMQFPDLSPIHRALEEIRAAKTKRLQVKIGDSLSFVNISDICFFQGEDYLTSFYTADGEKHLIESPLYELETRLPAGEFIRIHRSTIINMAYVRIIEKAGGGKLKAIMNQPANTELIISRSYTKKIRELFHSL
jgi:two-component system LytT family response regulator